MKTRRIISHLHRRLLPLVLLAAAWNHLTATGACADWADVDPGIAYREYALPGPVRVYVVRADRGTPKWIIDTMTSLGEVKGGRETVPDMAKRYDGSVTFDGRRYAIHAAINGDYFDLKTGVALSGQIISGWFVKRYNEWSGSGFVWTSDRRCFIGTDVQNGPKFQRVVFADGSEMKIDHLNEPRSGSGLTLYTPQYAANTGTTPDGVEVIVEASAPVGITAIPPEGSGTIVEVRRAAGSTPLYFDRVVLSASGDAAERLAHHAHTGDHVRIELGLKDAGVPSTHALPGDWTNAYAGVGGTKHILVHGSIPKDWEVKAAQYAAQGKKHGSAIQDPRTVVAFNEHAVFFAVIDGRSAESIGMTFTQAAEFCRDTLQATEATLQDGGGSCTLWLDGQVKNHPSGKPGQDKAGELRPVANGYLLAELLPLRKSEEFSTNQKIRSRGAANIRLGPGTDHAVAATLAADREGQVLPHRLNGVLAKGTNWWFCRFDAIEGWLTREQLETSQ